MILRNRLRRWLGIESDVATLKSGIERDVQNLMNGVIRNVNSLRDDVNTATDTFDAIKLEWWNRFSDERHANGAVLKAIREEIDNRASATQELSESAKEGYRQAAAALKVFQEHFSAELTRIDGLHYDSIRNLENRAAVIEGALAGIICPPEESPSVADRDRVIAILTEYHSSGFRPAHRDDLIKLIRGEA